MGNTFFKQSDREYGIMVLMRINLLKRLESSVYAFRLTIGRVLELIEKTIEVIRNYDPQKVIELQELNEDDFDMDDQNTDFFIVGKRVKIDLVDMDYKSWGNDLEHDRQVLLTLVSKISLITPEHDKKIRVLLDTIRSKLANPINGNNKKFYSSRHLQIQLNICPTM